MRHHTGTSQGYIAPTKNEGISLVIVVIVLYDHTNKIEQLYGGECLELEHLILGVSQLLEDPTDGTLLRAFLLPRYRVDLSGRA